MWPKMVTSEVRDELEMFESKSWKGVLVKLGARHDSCSTANTTPNSSLDSNDFSNLESAINCKDLWWSETNFAVGDKNILSDCWGNVSAGQVCAILGPSGAGKSSLLNVLAGRVTSGNGRSVKCRVKVGETRIRPVNFRKHIAYVMQDDALLATVTPREAFTLSATLRLSSDTPPHRIKLKVDHLIRELGLEECADVVVGGPLLKGLSGGQRKRTSVGVELATDPSLLLLDEPTTGLDSHSACNLIKLLKDIAQRGSAILCTVHQPSSEVFALFDQVIFMRAGRIAYQGPVESLGSYYANLGHVCPENYNPADFVMTLCQSLSEEEFAKVAMPVPMSSCPILSSKKAEKVEFTLPSSHLQQVYMLAKRDWVGLYRDPSSLIARLGITAALSIVCGCVFWQIGDKDLANPTNYNAHVAMTVFTIIIATNISGHGAILVYPFERPVFLREYDTGTYSAVAYMMSKLLTEVPVLLAQMLLQFMFVKTMSAMQANYFAAVGVAFGVAMVSNSLGMLLAAVASDVKETTEMSVAVFVPQILFTGVFTRLDQIPMFLRWAQYLCGMSYGTKLLFYLEFGPHVGLCQGSATAAANCERLLDSGGPTARLWWVNALGLLVLFVVSRLVTAAMLVTRAHKH